MTFEEAANRLNCSKRTIHNRIDKGLLKKTRRGRTVLLRRDEVEQLAESLGTDLPVLSRRSLYEQAVRIKRLEEKVAVMDAIWAEWNVQQQPLRPTAQDAGALYKMATDFLCATAYDYQLMIRWSQLFVQFDEVTLEKIADATNSLKPWEPFFLLVGRMKSYVEGSKELKNSIELQALHMKLDLGRKRVREAALFWIETGRGTVAKTIFESLGDSPEDILSRLVGEKAKAPKRKG